MLDLTIQNLGLVTVFHITGQITAGNDAGLRSAVLAQGTARILVLDLAGVNAIDAAGLGTLVDLRATVKAAAKQLTLMNLTPRVEALLRLTKLRAAFEVCTSSDVLNLNFRAVDPPNAPAGAIAGTARLPHNPEAA